MSDNSNEKIGIGIDLGTTNSVIAIWDGVADKIIHSNEDESFFPSCVAFHDNGEVVIGSRAKEESSTNLNTILEIKREMGTNFKHVVYGKEYTPEMISAFILDKIKNDAEDYLGRKIKNVVISVPAYFDFTQRKATENAAHIAGLNVLKIIPEPVAAALGYSGSLVGNQGKFNVLFYDFGGGTFDTAIIRLGDGKFEVVASDGDHALGGKDMDDAIINYLIEEFNNKEGINLKDDIIARNKLKVLAENAKIELSTKESTNIYSRFIAKDSNGKNIDLNIDFTQEKLNELVEDIVKKTEIPIKNLFEEANLNKKDIDKVILIGGPTKMPIVRKFVEELLNIVPERGIDPMEAVAIGSAMFAYEEVFVSILAPYSISIESKGGNASKLIKKGQTLPATRTKVYTTESKSQKEVAIRIFQGESKLVNNNIPLADFTLTDVNSGYENDAILEVTAKMDENGLVTVVARDTTSNKYKSIEILGPSNLSIEEIEINRELLKVMKANAEIRINAIELVKNISRFIEWENDLLEEDNSKLKELIENLNKSLEYNDIELIKKRTKEYSSIFKEIKNK